MCWEQALGVGVEMATNLLGQSSQASEQNEMYQQNAINANQSAGEQYSQLQTRLIQEASKATEDRMTLTREQMNAQGTALASSQNGGTSERMVLNDIARQTGRQKAAVDTNYKYKEQQYAADLVGVKAENQNRINSVSKGQDTNFLSTIISGLGVAIGSGRGTPLFNFGESANEEGDGK